MRSKLYHALFMLLAITIWAACKKESQNFLTPSWPQQVTVKATPTEATKRNFESELNLITNARTWSRDSVNISFDIDWVDADANPVNKIDLYLYVQEKTAAGPVLLGGKDGKLLKSISTISPDGKFSVRTSVDEIYNLFKSDFTITSRPNKLLPDDLFEIKWVLHGTDGQQYDGREKCLGEFCQYSFSTSTVADLWSGNFGYEYVQVGPGVQCCTTVPKVVVGDKGTLALSKNADGTYTVPDVEFGASWNGKAYSEKMSYNSSTGKVTLTNTTGEKVVWTFSNNKGNTIELKWATPYSGEWGVIRVTRTDGVKWPTNLN